MDPCFYPQAHAGIASTATKTTGHGSATPLTNLLRSSYKSCVQPTRPMSRQGDKAQAAALLAECIYRHALDRLVLLGQRDIALVQTASTARAANASADVLFELAIRDEAA